MDNNIILGIVITIIVIVPVLILATAGSRKQKKAIAKFKSYATSHSMNLGECD
ncbi:MAG: hypothetical protein HUK15_01180, partial [Bacteroidales bacterium]|nr:hypothetical protein [Bacteroidales bacterium]